MARCGPPGADAARAAALGPAGSLLALDNAEHVLDGVAACVQRQVSCLPHLHPLVTGQATLCVGAARVEWLHPLHMPTPPKMPTTSKTMRQPCFWRACASLTPALG